MDGFVITRSANALSSNIASALGSKKYYDYDDVHAVPTQISDNASLPAWYEQSLLVSADEKEFLSMRQDEENQKNDQMDMQELCVIENSFDINQKATVRRTMKPNPNKHKHLFRYSPDISVGETSKHTQTIDQKCNILANPIIYKYSSMLACDSK